MGLDWLEVVKLVGAVLPKQVINIAPAGSGVAESPFRPCVTTYPFTWQNSGSRAAAGIVAAETMCVSGSRNVVKFSQAKMLVEHSNRGTRSRIRVIMKVSERRVSPTWRPGYSSSVPKII